MRDDNIVTPAPASPPVSEATQDARCAAPAWSGPGSSAPSTRARPAWPARRWPASPRRHPSARAKPPSASALSEAYATPELLATAEDIDVVHICTPNHLHAELAALALEHGKHVVCEKPLAIGTAQAEELIAAAQASGRVATVPFVYRFHPVVREARARVRSGDARPGPADPRRLPAGLARLGRRRQLARRRRARRPVARVRRHRLALVRPRRVHHRRPHRGALRADLDRVRRARRARRTRARSRPPTATAARARAVTTEDAVTALFRTAGGAHGTLIISQVSPGRKNHLHVEIACAEASVRFEQERPETLWLGRRDGHRDRLARPGDARRRGRAPRRRPRRATRRATWTASTCSSPTATPRSPARHPRACRRSPTARAAPA